MGIEEEIKQSKFESEYNKLIVNILFTSSWLNCKQTRLFKQHNISPRQYNVLRILSGKHPIPASITTITQRMIDKNSNASRIVDKLLEKKLVVRKKGEEDRRQKQVSISDKGLKLLDKMDEKMNEFEKQFHSLSVNEARQLNELLDKLRD